MQTRIAFFFLSGTNYQAGPSNSNCFKTTAIYTAVTAIYTAVTVAFILKFVFLIFTITINAK